MIELSGINSYFRTCSTLSSQKQELEDLVGNERVD